MIRQPRYRLFFFLFILIGLGSAFAQADQPNSLVKDIISAYNRFNDPETDRLLELALKDIDSFSPRDQVTIFQYAAFRQFRKGDSFQAENYFWKLLDIDPNYSPDPLLTPPKLVTLFQKTKIKYLEDLQQRLNVLVKQQQKEALPWRSLVFPGWEQLRRGYRLKGGAWAAAGAATLAGVVQAVVRTRQKEDDYQKAVDATQIKIKYSEYNRLYQSQFYWSYALAAVWFTSHLDAVFFSPPKPARGLSVGLPQSYPGLSFTWRF